MNREIKFRAWDIECKTMRHWEWIRNCEYPFLSDEGGNDLLKENVFKLMQFTGLLDKNGNEIYEGDIVKYKQVERFGESVNEYTTEVRYTGSGFAPMNYEVNCEDDFYSCHISDIEVIGNIYESPELLK